ncbi:LPXTG cell wall anchor domain-containing protein [Streptococcus halichoeri]|uniref:LPXTG cell wall anchor domain-containing protein n=1 Tax=Streptococcus halichoeri TaxID=254785 RepID=UPI00135B622E|nr:LPXTG cell wall anchor domain-containing protein [Streptococcus halichoeri]
MAKHHWNWTKKAVLASLMLGASVLVTSTGVKAEETPKSKYLTENFNKQAFDLTSEAIKLKDNSIDDIISGIEKIFRHLKTEDLMKLFTQEFLGGPNTFSSKAIDKIFDFYPQFQVESKELHDLIVHGKVGQQKYNKFGLDQLGKDKIPYQSEHKLSDGELFTMVLSKELFRRSQNYESIVNDLKKNDETLANTSKKLTSEMEKSAKLKKDLTETKEDSQALKEKSKELTSKLDASEKNNNDLQSKMKDLEEQSKQTSEDLKASQEKVNALNKQISDSTSQNQNLQASLEQEKKNLNDLQQRFDAATKANTEDKAKLQSDLDAKQAEVNSLQAKINESQANLDKLTAEKAAAEAKVAELTTQKADIEAKLNSQTELSAEEKAKLEKQLADIQSKIAEKDASIKSLEGQLDTLKRQEHDTTPSTPETPQVPEVKPEDKPAEPQQPETKPQAPQAPEADKKPSTPKKPEIKPAPTPAIPEVKPSTPHTPEKPGKGKPATPKANHSKAHHAATPASPHMATQNTAAHLPQTGETTVNPFFSVAALSIIASAGVLATKRKED